MFLSKLDKCLSLISSIKLLNKYSLSNALEFLSFLMKPFEPCSSVFKVKIFEQHLTNHRCLIYLNPSKNPVNYSQPTLVNISSAFDFKLVPKN